MKGSKAHDMKCDECFNGSTMLTFDYFGAGNIFLRKRSHKFKLRLSWCLPGTAPKISRWSEDAVRVMHHFPQSFGSAYKSRRSPDCSCPGTTNLTSRSQVVPRGAEVTRSVEHRLFLLPLWLRQISFVTNNASPVPLDIRGSIMQKQHPGLLKSSKLSKVY